MNISAEQEKELIHRLKKGDRKAFDEIYHAYKATFYNFAFNTTNSVDEAKDLIQDTFYDLWVRKDKLDITTALKSYLFTSIKNRFLNKVQREKRFEHYADIILSQLKPEYELNPEEEIVMEEKKQFLLDKINRLPKKCREIFVLNKMEDKSITEISESLTLSPQTVKNQLVKATKHIKPYQQEILASSLSLLWFFSKY